MTHQWIERARCEVEILEKDENAIEVLRGEGLRKKIGLGLVVDGYMESDQYWPEMPRRISVLHQRDEVKKLDGLDICFDVYVKRSGDKKEEFMETVILRPMHQRIVGRMGSRAFDVWGYVPIRKAGEKRKVLDLKEGDVVDVILKANIGLGKEYGRGRQVWGGGSIVVKDVKMRGEEMWEARGEEPLE